MGFPATDPSLTTSRLKIAEIINLPSDHVIGFMIAVGKVVKTAMPKGGQLVLPEATFPGFPKEEVNFAKGPVPPEPAAAIGKRRSTPVTSVPFRRDTATRSRPSARIRQGF